MKTPLNRKHVFANHSAPVYALCPGLSNDSFFSASGDHYVVEWNTASLEQNSFAVNLGETAYSVLHIHEYHLLLAGSSSGGLHVIDTKNKSELRHFNTHTQGIYDILWDSRSEQLFVAGGDGFVSIWSVPSFELIRNIPFSTGKIRQMAMSPDGKQLALACGDGTVRILEPEFFNELYTLPVHPEGATAVAWHPRKPVLITGGKDAHLRLFHTTEEYRSLLNIAAHNFAIYAISFSPGGEFCATASRDKTIKIWNPDTFDPILRLDATSGGHTHSVNDILWTGERMFLSCGDDRKIILWEI